MFYLLSQNCRKKQKKRGIKENYIQKFTEKNAKTIFVPNFKEHYMVNYKFLLVIKGISAH